MIRTRVVSFCALSSPCASLIVQTAHPDSNGVRKVAVPTLGGLGGDRDRLPSLGEVKEGVSDVSPLASPGLS